MSAFVELILAEGYESVAVGDIAIRANVGRSTLYLHYSSKEALLADEPPTSVCWTRRLHPR